MSAWNKTKPCPWMFVLNGIYCNEKKCDYECKPQKGGEIWK